jgi:hypothetical protein
VALRSGYLRSLEFAVGGARAGRIIEDGAASGRELLSAGCALVNSSPFIFAFCLPRNLGDVANLASMTRHGQVIFVHQRVRAHPEVGVPRGEEVANDLAKLKNRVPPTHRFVELAANCQGSMAT